MRLTVLNERDNLIAVRALVIVDSTAISTVLPGVFALTVVRAVLVLDALLAVVPITLLAFAPARDPRRGYLALISTTKDASSAGLALRTDVLVAEASRDTASGRTTWTRLAVCFVVRIAERGTLPFVTTGSAEAVDLPIPCGTTATTIDTSATDLLLTAPSAIVVTALTGSWIAYAGTGPVYTQTAARVHI